MNELMSWPKCQHEVDLDGWAQAQYGSIMRGRAPVRFEYSQARCMHCARPLLFVGEPVSAEHLRMLRRHVAWWMLGKEGEHASNTVVVPLMTPITRT